MPNMRTVLKAGVTYSWWMQIILAPPEAVASGGNFTGQERWGEWTASPGETVQSVADGAHRLVAQNLGRHPGQVLGDQFSLKS